MILHGEEEHIGAAGNEDDQEEYNTYRIRLFEHSGLLVKRK